MDSIIQQIATELNKRPDHVENVVRLVGAGVRQQGTDLSQERIHLFRAAADVGGGREDRLHLFFRHAEGGLGGQTGQ